MGAKKIPKYNKQCSPAATELYLVLRYSVFVMDSVSLGITDDQTENWNFVSVDICKNKMAAKITHLNYKNISDLFIECFDRNE